MFDNASSFVISYTSKTSLTPAMQTLTETKYAYPMQTITSKYIPNFSIKKITCTRTSSSQHPLIQGPPQLHSHCANTHHRALRSASTNPLHVPFSPILMTVSHAVPSASFNTLTCSLFLVSRMIFPLGVWIASLAGFIMLLPDDPDEACDGFV